MLTLLLFLSSLSANSEIYLTETDKAVKLWRELYLYEEPENSNQDWQQVYATPLNFQAQEKPTLNFGYRNSPIWLKVTLVNKTDVHRWGVSIDNAAIDYIDMYLIDENGQLIDSAELGDMRSFTSRKIHTASQSASFDLRPNEHSTLLIKVYGQSTLFLPVLLATERQLQVEQNVSMVFVAMLVGIMFALGLNNLYLYFTVRDKTYAYYCFYLVSLIGFALYTSGLGYQYFWRDMIGLQNVITFVFLGMLFHGALSFSQQYLRTKTNLPGAHQFINYFKFLAYLSIVISLVFSKSAAVSFLTVINLTFIVTVIYCGVQSARQRYTPAYFYLVSWFFLIFGLLTYNLTVKGVVEPNFFTTKAIAIGSAIEAILLSSALAFRMKKLIVERNDANSSARKALLDSNREMAKSLAAAEQYNRAKDEFLSVVNHEFRTPMNGIIGNLQLMGYEELDEAVQDYLVNAQSSSKDMMNIIDNLLFITESSSQQLSINLSEINLREYFAELLAPFNEIANKKSVVFEVNIDDDLPSTLSIDAQKFRRLVEILVSNATKFTAKGQVTILLRLKTVEEESYLEMVVKDTGIGMTDGQIEKLFTPFSQANTSTNRPADGLGLGLAVAKQISKVLQADIKLESQIGHGTKATVVMPIE